jgi:molecular chaperone DnaJ
MWVFHKSTCGGCGGTGSFKRSDTCGRCGGDGRINEVYGRYLTIPDEWDTCPKCDGSGSVEEEHTCGRCHGSGEQEDSEWVEPEPKDED